MRFFVTSLIELVVGLVVVLPLCLWCWAVHSWRHWDVGESYIIQTVICRKCGRDWTRVTS